MAQNTPLTPDELRKLSDRMTAEIEKYFNILNQYGVPAQIKSLDDATIGFSKPEGTKEWTIWIRMRDDNDPLPLMRASRTVRASFMKYLPQLVEAQQQEAKKLADLIQKGLDYLELVADDFGNR